MNTCRLVGLFCIVLATGIFDGCEIVTDNPEPDAPSYAPARNVVINELYILPEPIQHPFRWIEFYNPTGHSINMSRWTLGYRTKRLFTVSDTSGTLLYFSQDSVPVYHDVPLRRIGGTAIPAYGLLTIVSNSELMKNYTTPVTLPDPIEVGESLFFMDSLRVDSLVLALYDFKFLNADQLVLKDSTGTVVDVVRYGGYVYNGSDPSLSFPGNHSLGAIVPYQSYARYAGAYTSGANRDAAQGNSATDFYITGVQIANTRPIPQWLSQAFKQ